MIPKLHYISQGHSAKEHLENIQKACSAGAELVQLCFKNVAESEFLDVAKQARAITAHFQTRLIINKAYKIAKEVKADGVHLEKTDHCPILVRLHLYTWQIIGGTANNIQDCKTLLEKQVDYITLSPFKSKEDNASLGLKGYSLLVEELKTETPMIGFGGITTADVTDILETGIAGIAISEAITQNFDSIKEFNILLKASATEEQRHSF